MPCNGNGRQRWKSNGLDLIFESTTSFRLSWITEFNIPKCQVLVRILFFIFILLSIFIIFAFTITRQGADKDYKFGDYSLWMQKRIRNWDHVMNCLHSHGLCSDDAFDRSQDYYNYGFNVALIQVIYVYMFSFVLICVYV